MTVASETSRDDYVGTGATDTYSYTFRIFAATDLLVTQVTTAGVETELVYLTDYTVTGVGSFSGGDIVLTAGNLTTGYGLTLRFRSTLTQNTDIRNQAGFFPEVIEDALDRLTKFDQQQQDELDRSIKLPETETGSMTLPTVTERAGSFLGFDALGDPISGTALTSSVPATAFAETILDDATAADVLTTLGVSAFIQTILNDATAAAARATLGVADPISVCNGRLTLTSGTPVTTADVTAAVSVYFTPYKGNRIALYDGSANWVAQSFAELTLAVPAVATQMYDVFAYNNAGVVALEATAWASDTTRATALTLQDGVLVKTGATTRRYLGSFRTVAAGQTEDSIARRFVWNYYNRAVRSMRALEGTDSWNYTTATYRQANGSTANQLDFIVGWNEDIVTAEVLASVSNTAGSTRLAVAIGLDSTAAPATGALLARVASAGANYFAALSARWHGHPGVGRHYLSWLEHSEASGTTTWYGDNAGDTLHQSGIYGSLLA